MSSSPRLPKLIAFDLDYTLWDMWIDTHVTGPLRHAKNGTKVIDRHGTEVVFYDDVGGILRGLRREGVLVAACSRTHAAHLAKQALSLIRIPPSHADDPAVQEQPAIELFDNLEIYPGSKIPHFRALHEKTGVPYEEMLFFDDESRNREVERLGVRFHLTPDGVSNAVFEAGVMSWNARRAVASAE
ncbi:hypothetical protein MIND_01319800 [Mycena indigotica]|uniref:Magnesium-dependent phosphatase-1 n=1 Tax=Mycena indigotica TaxID=2126181 RepID=A0A8H6VR82_9AGAR|nr:uncharacterized protein MIND_01319800 [Mycena indigotica]KAF7290789.1 hypothetical protein MIND_01319800 [Mycena indigotica]